MNFGDIPIPRQKVLLGAGLGLVTAVVAACATYGKTRTVYVPEDAVGSGDTEAANC